MKTITLSRGEKTYVDDDVFEKVGHLKWYKSFWGYAVRFERVDGKKTCIFLHRRALQPRAGFEIDHIDRDRLNNVRSNLRYCTKTQNQGNRLGSRKSGYKGVSYSARGTWDAYITIAGKSHRLGGFHSPERAALSYDAAAREHFGEFALLNNPPPEILAELERLVPA